MSLPDHAPRPDDPHAAELRSLERTPVSAVNVLNPTSLLVVAVIVALSLIPVGVELVKNRWASSPPMQSVLDVRNFAGVVR